MRLFFVLPFFSLISCEDNSAKETTIRGQVQTYGTDDKIDHPSVLMQLVKKDRAGCFGCGSYFVIKDSDWTDENGEFRLTHKLYDSEDYYIKVKESTVKESWGYLVPTHSSIDSPEHRVNQRGGILQKNFNLFARGWVRFSLANSVNSGIDRFSYNFGGGAQEQFFGAFNKEVIWSFTGNIDHGLFFGVTSNGIDSLWQDNIFVPAFDTIDYEVRF